MLIALKYNEDDYFNNEFYAKVGGVTKKEIDKLEYEFLIRSEYKLFVSEDVFEKYNNYLITAHEEEEDEDDSAVIGVEEEKPAPKKKLGKKKSMFKSTSRSENSLKPKSIGNERAKKLMRSK